MSKFRCPKCGKEIEVSKYKSIFKGDKVINIDNLTDKEIICEDCKIPMEFVKKEGNYETAGIGKFTNLSPLEKQQVLRKRSREDAKKNKYVANEMEKDRFNG